MGLRPTRPQRAAGFLVEPPVSEPKALGRGKGLSQEKSGADLNNKRHAAFNMVFAHNKHAPTAVAAALPPELPPAMHQSSRSSSGLDSEESFANFAPTVSRLARQRCRE